MYKIFFKDRVIHLTEEIEKNLNNDFDTILKYGNQGELADFIANFEKDESLKSAFIYHHNLHELLKIFRDCFRSLPAAGGLIWNDDFTAFLGIKRLGVYDLPKGKVEKDETFEEAAIREVKEECNIPTVELLDRLTSTFHTYKINEQNILKETRWYEMKYVDSIIPSPQREENIEDIFWVNKEKLEEFKNNTYPSIIEVLEKSLRISEL